MTNWVVVSNMFYFHPYLGKIPILTNIFPRPAKTSNVIIWLLTSKHPGWKVRPLGDDEVPSTSAWEQTW